MTNEERAKALVDKLLSIESNEDDGMAEGMAAIATAFDAACADAVAAATSTVAEVLRMERELVARRVTEARAKDPLACCIAMHDPSLRRGLWCVTGDNPSYVDTSAKRVTLLAGREGDDAKVTLHVGDIIDPRAMNALLDVLSAARYGAAALHDEHEAREWSRWTPVGDGLPSVDQDVLVTYALASPPAAAASHMMVCTAHLCPTYDEDIAPHEWRDGDWTVPNVLAWQPLPAPWVAP